MHTYAPEEPAVTTPDSYNAAIIEEFRATGGHVGGVFENSPLLLLHHTGARSGIQRISPVGYVEDGDRYVVIASNGGSPRHPAWYHNLRSSPDVTIEVGAETLAAVAEEATGPERERLFQLMADHAPQIVGHQASVARAIPIMVLTPARSRT
jgi:deazaflavin-dependent oxidoreductase (nitroreductase family)